MKPVLSYCDKKVDEALAALDAPSGMLQNLNVATLWKGGDKTAALKGLAEALEWLNQKADDIKAEYAKMGVELGKCADAMRDEVINLDKAGTALPKRFNGNVTLNEAKTACSYAFIAGILEAVRILHSVPKHKSDELDTRNIALRRLNDAIQELSSKIQNTYMVDKDGNVIA